MGHPSLKKKSKRLSCRLKYKIDKKVREHNRKKRREARKQRKGSKTKAITAPQQCPFKEQIIEDFNEAKAKEKEMMVENKRIIEENAANGITLEQLVQDARIRGDDYMPIDRNEEIDRKINAAQKMESSSLTKEFKKVVNEADVILEVVDARDPLGTRCKVVEETVARDPKKRLVIVLNKADLVPRENLEKWLKYLRQSRPAVPFKASVQQQAQKLGRRTMLKKSKKKKNLEKLMSVSSCVGAEFLMKLLANYRRSDGFERSIIVGVVGVPNVGKSSIINSLRRAKACRVGAEPGVTRTLQTVQISANIKILDSPGIVMENPVLKNNTLLCLKNLVKTDQLNDPTLAAQAILYRSTKEQMMELYNVSNYNTPEEFLLSLSKRFGLLGKKGIPDTFKAAKMLVQDWNRGKIRYYTLPPEDSADTHISAKIVSKLGENFDVSQCNPSSTGTESEMDTEFNELQFAKEENELLDMINDERQNKFVTYLSLSNNDPENPDFKELKNLIVDTTVAAKKKGKLRWRKKKKGEEKENMKNIVQVKQKKVLKLAAKKKRKEEARKTKRDNSTFSNNEMMVD
ncbi:guanine nucleotide-binding protein-like 3 homolog [Planococcus citri]|uniref:guanine nucleotide-binding protein-like 3 homolog n=1 Tax=Planococcus citri TaxID=170843 RepID=UPI0031F801CF